MNKMKNKLYKLFDYQKFEKNKHLENIIEECNEDVFVLSDDLLGAVAGGKQEVENTQKDKENHS